MREHPFLCLTCGCELDHPVEYCIECLPDYCPECGSRMPLDGGRCDVCEMIDDILDEDFDEAMFLTIESELK